ncbi:glycosyl transferase family 90-domain-containing protein [Obelidium mucronatum]|nr:glycosyl transferase family 90-domain-containing protein [Obelidium mucronatum]
MSSLRMLAGTCAAVIILVNVYILSTVTDPHSKVSPMYLERYIEQFGRDPPKNYNRWVAFALAKGCHTDPRNYKQIYTDLDPWIQKGTIDPAAVNALENKAVTMTIKFFFGRFYGSPISTLLNPGRSIFSGSKNFKFVINTFDEPLHIPADSNTNSRTTNPVYHNQNEVFEHSSCLREHYDSVIYSNDTMDGYDAISGNKTLREQHGYFMHPDSFVTQNRGGPDEAAPIFSQSKLSCFRDVLMPMMYHMEIANNRVTDTIPWEKKLNVLFWRGSTTGGSYRSNAPWERYPRTRLMDWGLEYERRHPGSTFDAGKGFTPPRPDGLSVDVGFNMMQQYDHTVMKKIGDKYGFKKGVKFSNTKRFKYLLVLDGNTWPSRLQQYLQTNSVVLYNGIFTDYYNWKLIPMVHYVPFRLDYSDLEEKLDWLMKNDDKAREIAQNAKKLMERVSRPEEQQCYTTLLMLEYSSLYGA